MKTKTRQKQLYNILSAVETLQAIEHELTQQRECMTVAVDELQDGYGRALDGLKTLRVSIRDVARAVKENMPPEPKVGDLVRITVPDRGCPNDDDEKPFAGHVGELRRIVSDSSLPYQVSVDRDSRAWYANTYYAVEVEVVR